VGSETISYCDGGTWAYYDCDDLCIDSGYDYSSSCSYSSDSGDDTCWCGNY